LLSVQVVKERAHSLKLKTPDILVICLAVQGTRPQTVTQIRKVALESGFRRASSWNISRELAKRPDQVIRTVAGWEVTPAGLDQANNNLGLEVKPRVLSAAVESLNQHIDAIAKQDTKLFLSEAVACLENHLLRAAVVLIWVGAVAVLQDEVVAKKLPEFNAEALRRDAKWKAAKDADGLSRMKEADFLVIIEAIAVIGKNVRQELEGCLKLRNGCGHPNSLKLGENKVAAHLETLILNVFAKFI